MALGLVRFVGEVVEESWAGLLPPTMGVVLVLVLVVVVVVVEVEEDSEDDEEPPLIMVISFFNLDTFCIILLFCLLFSASLPVSASRTL